MCLIKVMGIHFSEILHYTIVAITKFIYSLIQQIYAKPLV